MSEPTQRAERDDDQLPSDSTSDEPRWTLLDLDGLVDAYWDHVVPDLRAEDRDPETERPTHSWLSEHGHRGLVYALREYHDRTFTEFWNDDLGLENKPETYDWPTTNEETITALEEWLESRSDRSGLADSSIETLRYRLARYVRAYKTVTDDGDLLGPVAPDSDVPPAEATDRAWDAVDRLDSDLAPQTTRRIHEAVREWYDHLKRRRRVAVNPVAGLDEEYRWHRQAGSPESVPSLSTEYVRALHQAAETPRERLLVVALCGWGLRANEVAALHSDQLQFDTTDVPVIAFETRKNGPSRVSMLYGEETAKERLSELGVPPADVPGLEQTSGTYLFPSNRSESGHRTRQTISNRFETLADRAGLPNTIGGTAPSPQLCRRWWYDVYSAAHEEAVDALDRIAAEQGSTSGSVVAQDYLSDDRLRQLRRETMRERLAGAFE